MKYKQIYRRQKATGPYSKWQRNMLTAGKFKQLCYTREINSTRHPQRDPQGETGKSYPNTHLKHLNNRTSHVGTKTGNDPDQLNTAFNNATKPKGLHSN